MTAPSLDAVLRERAPHVVAETRTVYRSVRGTKLTKHAAYIAAAKEMIAARCRKWDNERLVAVLAANEDEMPGDYRSCSKDGPDACRFHKLYEPERYDYDGEPIGPTGMAYYVRVLPRLVRFLKFVDRKRAEPRDAR